MHSTGGLGLSGDGEMYRGTEPKRRKLRVQDRPVIMMRGYNTTVRV